MKLSLRLSLLSFGLMLVCNLMAQEVTLDFSENNWGLPESSANKATAEATFTNGSYSITLAAADGYYFNKDGYLMLGKSGSTLTLPAFSFDVERIDIVGRSQASANTLQNIYVGEDAVSTQTKGAQGTNEYEIAANYQSAGNVYMLKVESAHNTQIVKILIWKKGTAQETQVPVVDNIRALTELGSGADAIFKLDNCRVTYAKGKYVYVRDKTDGMCFYNQTAMSEATNKWKLGGKIEGKVSIYNGLTQFTINDASGMTYTEVEEYQPVVIDPGDADAYIADLVTLNQDITVFADGTRYYTSEDRSLQIYDNFRLGYTIVASRVYKGLTGVIIPYKEQLEIAPTRIPDDGTGITDVNAEMNQDQRVYNLAGQRVLKMQKGINIINGKKFLIK